ncbi:MAG: HDOD domain-containing protein [Cellvibrionaceae bacterium]
MSQINYYSVYKTVVQKLINDEEQLPSLPSITLKIRQAIANPNSDHAVIGKLIQLDPSLSTLLLKHATSPIYKRPVPPKTIDGVLAMIGLPTLESLVMAHSIKSLFVMKSPELKKLFRLSWERMILKAAISLFIAKKLGFRPAEEVMTASILSEVGTLAVLSAFNSDLQIPNQKIYFQLCKRYSKSLSTILLSKWGLEKYLIQLTQFSGQWDCNKSRQLMMVDIINLAIYSTVQHQSPKNDLPAIETLSSYKKLPPSLNTLSPSKELVIIQSNLETIDNIIASIR